jgi:hypothetical protein
LFHVKLSATELNAVCHDASQDNEVVIEVWEAEHISEVL